MYLGNRLVDSTVYVPFHTFNSSGAAVTLTGLAVTDIEIYKDGSITQRASDAGYTLLDTDGIDFDGITGLHGFKIDLSDNTDAGFFVAGSHYMVAVSAVTVDAQTVNIWAASFDIVAASGTIAEIADAVWDELQADHLDAGSFGEVATESAAIKAKTDSLTFTVALQANVNIQSVNDVTVTGNGVGTPWGA